MTEIFLKGIIVPVKGIFYGKRNKNSRKRTNHQEQKGGEGMKLFLNQRDGMVETFIRRQVTERGLDPRTEKAYRLDLQHLYTWMEERQVPEFQEKDIQEYLSYLAGEKALRRSTVTRKYRVFSYFLQFCRQYVHKESSEGRGLGSGTEAESGIEIRSGSGQRPCLEEAVGGEKTWEDSRSALEAGRSALEPGQGLESMQGPEPVQIPESGQRAASVSSSSVVSALGADSLRGLGPSMNEAVDGSGPGKLSSGEVDRFFQAISREYESLDSDFRRRVCLRDDVMMELLFYHGIQVSELLNLSVKDYDQKTGILKVPGKRGRGREFHLFSRQLKEKMDRWVLEREHFLKDGERQDGLFVSKLGRPLSMKMVINVFDKYRKLAGIEAEYKPKDLKGSVERYAVEKLGERMEEVGGSYIEGLML